MMKSTRVQSEEFLTTEKSFREWLELLNFERSTVRYAPVKAREFFNWLERHDLFTVNDITKGSVSDYFDYLGKRENRIRGGRLSRNYLRSHLTALRKLSRYLRETGHEGFETDITLRGPVRKRINVFTRKEIKALYSACEGDLLGIRDRAMLGVYYGCGLRRSEGINLDMDDVNLEKGLLYVSRGKNYKQRFVPFTGMVKDDFFNYLKYSRPMFAAGNDPAFFISQRGKRMCEEAMAQRLQALKEKVLIDRPASLHTLRHSIATHLLQSGMSPEKIKRFLGHRSLETTQIYTHLKYESE
jgi:integrase/recombinase XerD